MNQILSALSLEHFASIITLWNIRHCLLIADEEDPVRFIPSVVDHPDLPSWLLFTQKNLQSDGFLYGTPHNTEDSTSIQVQTNLFLPSFTV